MNFKDINFGLSDAQSESMDCPKLLKDGYLNIMQVIETVNNPRYFLFLGYKGSGKSALSEHLKLCENNYIVNQQSLKDFPFKFFDKILNNEDRVLKYKIIWRWLLCASVLASLCKTEKDINDNTIQAIKVFTQLGLFPVIDISTLLRKSSSTTISATIQSLGISHTINKEYGEADMELLTGFVKDIILSIKETQPHLIIIDELDDILTPNGRQFDNIASLINEAKDLNAFFHKNYLPIKIVILCRTDMFERLPGQNLNKIRQSNSFTFTWYKEGRDSNKQSELVDLINKRAKLKFPEIRDVFEEFFPKEYDGKDIYSSLLNYTRHIPRDFVQLMNYIQENCNTNKVTNEAIKKGIRMYSTEYFLPEISNELAGYLPNSIIQPVFNVISSMRSQYFTYDQFAEKFNEMIIANNVTPMDVLKVLYDCSAIGHIHFYKEFNGTRVLFKYRNRSTSFDKSDKIFLHRGLWKAMNVSY